MIYAIAALDSKNGIATDTGIPWELPADKQYFRDKTVGAPILMGYRMYEEASQPLPDRRNLVVVRPGTSLREGFEPVEDVEAFIEPYRTSQEILWVIGGARIYEELLPHTHKLYLTRIEADFNCTKFFPKFEPGFRLVEQSPEHMDNDLKFRYEVWDSQLLLK